MEAYAIVDIERHTIRKTYFKNKKRAEDRVNYLNEKYGTSYRVVTLEHDKWDDLNPEVDLYDWEHNL